MERFFIAIRNSRGMESSASATALSNCSRVMTHGPSGAASARLRGPDTRSFSRHHPEIFALVPYRAYVAQRLRPADSTSVENERVRGAGPPFARESRTELLFDDFGFLRVG